MLLSRLYLDSHTLGFYPDLKGRITLNSTRNSTTEYHRKVLLSSFYLNGHIPSFKFTIALDEVRFNWGCKRVKKE